jgi:bla regulator protein blaR1
VAIAALASQTPDWQTAAGGKMAFEIASIKPVASELFHPPTFPLDNGSAFRRGGRFSATFALWTYISFAYKLSASEGSAAPSHLPTWVNDGDHDSYAIDATAPASATKDQMRLMTQSLLAERCKLAVHFETREMPVFALTLAHPGKPGPKLRPHSEGPPCPDGFAGIQERPVTGDVFPPNCETVSMVALKTVRWGARDLTMPAAANAIYTFSNADKPVVDQTGLEGRFDFVVELTRQEFNGAGASGADAAPPPAGTAFVNAMREQLGLKLISTKAPVRILVVDHVERPSEN